MEIGELCKPGRRLKGVDVGIARAPKDTDHAHALNVTGVEVVAWRSVEQLSGGVRPGVEQMGGCPGLGVGDGHVVCHHIVEVAGDPQSLLGDAQAGFFLAGAFSMCGAGLDCVQIGGLQPRTAAQRQGSRSHKAGPIARGRPLQSKVGPTAIATTSAVATAPYVQAVRLDVPRASQYKATMTGASTSGVSK